MYLCCACGNSYCDGASSSIAVNAYPDSTVQKPLRFCRCVLSTCVHVLRGCVHVVDACDRVGDHWVTIGTVDRIASSLSACAFKMQEAEAALMAVICQTGSDDGSERCEPFVSACA